MGRCTVLQVTKILLGISSLISIGVNLKHVIKNGEYNRQKAQSRNLLYCALEPLSIANICITEVNNEMLSEPHLRYNIFLS
jgi:hypothetical protein